MATDKKALTKNKANDYFTATIEGEEPFKAAVIKTSLIEDDKKIEIKAFRGLPGDRSFFVTIDASTPNGEHDFLESKQLSVSYISGTTDDGTAYAQLGQFTSHLDNVSKKYRLRFNLTFGGGIKIQGDLEVTG